MTTLTLNDPTSAVENAAQVLRRTGAAVRVHFTWMGTRRTLTRAQKDEAAEAFGAAGQFLSAGKKLIDTRHGAFRKLTALRTRIGQFWKGLTLPYVEPGVRLIRQDDVEHFAHVMAGYRAELTQAETELNAAYAQVKNAARQRLGRLYHEGDYPETIQGLFGVDWDFPSVEPPSYLMQLHPEIYRQEQQRIAHRFEEAVQLAEQSFISELAKLVSHLSERLAAGADGNCKVFRDSAVGNLQEFFAQFRRLNIHSNAQLDQLVEQAQQIVRGVRPQELRDNDALRQQIATQLNSVQSTLDGLLVDQPRRRIVRAQTQRMRASPGAGGTVSCWPHAGQAILLPASLSCRVRACWQREQEKAIMANPRVLMAKEKGVGVAVVARGVRCLGGLRSRVGRLLVSPQGSNRKRGLRQAARQSTKKAMHTP